MVWNFSKEKFEEFVVLGGILKLVTHGVKSAGGVL